MAVTNGNLRIADKGFKDEKLEFIEEDKIMSKTFEDEVLERLELIIKLLEEIRRQV